MKRPQRVLLATDFSQASERAWRKAVELASEGARLLIAHALSLPVPLSPEGWPLPRMADELAAAARRDSAKALGSLLKKTRRAGVAAKGLLLAGREEEAIARAARKHGTDLIVVGTHGRTGVFHGCFSAAWLLASSPPLRVRCWPYLPEADRGARDEHGEHQ